MIRKNILVIDDDEDIREILSYNLTQAGFNVDAFESPKIAIEFALQNRPDLVICDWMMSELDGLEVCKIFTRTIGLMDIPFIMLTCKSDEIDVVTALEVGSDDYITKPVRIREIIARIKKLLVKIPATFEKEKPSINTAETEDQLNYHGIVLNTTKHKVWIDEKEIEFTHSEFKLIQLFLMNQGRVFSRDYIIEKLNGIDHLATERSVDVLVAGLRKKLGVYKKMVETVRGVGYRLEENKSFKNSLT